MDHAIDDYDPQHSNATTVALQQIRERLIEDHKQHTSLLLQNSHSLRIHSIKHDYSFQLLNQFYQELMISNFPLESERDDLDDWIACLDPAEIQADDPGPDMDVLLLVMVMAADNNNNNGNEYSETTTTPVVTILAGFAVEYYKRAQIGLLTYCVISTEVRRQGILGAMHPVAIEALQQLHALHSSETKGTCRRPIPILAETNTIHAGDVSPDECQARHRALYRLGYRLLQFPYVQPPLQEGEGSFDEIMLLVYCGNHNGHDDDSILLYPNMEIPTQILHGYVLDFFMSVYGYHHHGDNGEVEGEYVHHWYYQLVTWFLEHTPTTAICPELPWNDVTDDLRSCWKQEQQQAHVVIVGAGISGLVAAVTLAQMTTQPLQITLVEAHARVGGRIRSVLTNTNYEEDGSLPLRQYVDPKLVEVCQKFAPWPISIGAEFVHGVDSLVNELIVQNNISVEETFDLCSVEDYPSDHAFTQRSLTKPLLTTTKRNKGHIKMFGDGKCWDLRDTTTTTTTTTASSSDSRFPSLVRKSQQLWGELIEISESYYKQEEASHPTIIPEDASLAAFVEEKMASESDADIATVISILEAQFANTSGSSSDSYGVNEASREDFMWDYAESNYRTEGCFAEFINYHLDEIDQINRCADRGEGLARIKILTNCPIVSIRNVAQGDKSADVPKVKLTRLDNLHFLADKTIVTVPLAVLKANKIQFEGDLTLPAEKRKAIDAVNMFSGAKAHLLLRRNVDIASTPSDLLDYTELFFCPGEIFSQAWIRRDSNTVLVTGFVVANCCDKLKDQIDCGESAQSLFLDQLQRMFSSDPASGENIFLNETNPTCSAFAWHDWSEDEYILGMYSSPSVGAGWQSSASSSGCDKTADKDTCRDFLAKPIKDLVFFAGEHTNIKTCATVQAAMESGTRAAEEVLHSMLL
jgi:hypothetical protein